MRKKIKLIYIMWFSVALGQSEPGQHIPSDERGDPNYRRFTNIDINRVRATVFNYGITGRTEASPLYYPFEWPVNSGKMYIAMTALAVGAKVATEDSTVALVTIPFRSDQSGNSKEWEPVPSYLNPNSEKLAKSDDENTWPLNWPDKMGDEDDPGWAGSWNGYFGKNQFNAEQEIYYKISDDRNFESGYTYVPDTTDLSRQGAGLLTGVRIMEWNQILIEDVVFILHEVKNDGTKDLDKVAFSLWLADLVGGDGDSSDDVPDFDLIDDVAWSMDGDGIGNLAFGGDPVGVAATSFIETPGNNIDRIDNDGDGEADGPIITEDMIENYINELDGLDNNGNGLIDENMTHVPFGAQQGVSYADRIDNDWDGETNSPVVTQAMVDAASSEQWLIWPSVSSGDDELQNGIIHLIGVDAFDLDMAYADGIDNNADPDNPYILEYPNGTGADVDSPVITQAIIDTAAADEWQRYRVPGTEIILYSVGIEDLGRPFADGIDNDGDGAIDEGIDEGIDEMIDESRDDFIDNDYDWDWTDDDVGLYGDGSGGTDAGSYDQKPTSGSGSGFPGEPNIDKTDVSESDQMGLTSVGYDPAGAIPINNSATMWNSYMQPGKYWDGIIIDDDNDLFVTSGYFPLKAGQTERIAMAVCLGNDQSDALRNKFNAQTAYDFDYRFAKSPNPPNVTVVPGDGQVTLYWDSSAENSYDAFMDEIGGDPYDFEGYKIYRATDWEFNDAYKITDGEGNPTFFKPYEQNGEPARWDKIDGKTGWHPLDMNGAQFYLGDDTGLQHSYVDYDVVNGQTYYYAVVAYDFGGDETNNIMPSDSPMRIRLNSLTGDLEMGPNVVKAVPSPPSAGYVPGQFEDDFIRHISGTSNGKVNFEVIDPAKIIDEQTYQITFSDTLLPRDPLNVQSYDTLTTKYWYLENITTEDTLVKPEFLILDSLYTFEPFIDVGNGIWDEGEPYIDSNSNGQWDDAEPYEILDEDIIQFTDLNGNGVWDDAEEFTDLGNGICDDVEVFADVNENGYWDAGESFEDYDNNGLCGVYNGADNDGDGYCDGELCDDINDNGCDPNDQAYFYIIDDGMCNCPEPYVDSNSNGQWDDAEEFTDCGIEADTLICETDDNWNDNFGNGIWDDAEKYIDLNGNGTWDESIIKTIVDTVIYINPLPEHNDFRVIDGFRLSFENTEYTSFDNQKSYWSNSDLSLFELRPFPGLLIGVGAALPFDYRIIFSPNNNESISNCFFDGLGTEAPCIHGSNSSRYFPSDTINFKVQKQISLTGNESNDWIDIPFAFKDVSPYIYCTNPEFEDLSECVDNEYEWIDGVVPDGLFNSGPYMQDWIVFLDHWKPSENFQDNNGNEQYDPGFDDLFDFNGNGLYDADSVHAPSWLFKLPQDSCDICNNPQPGDTAFIFVKKPFLKEDVYKFTTKASRIDPVKANQDRWKSNIKVVPNPYYGASAFEQKNTFSSGRGPREIQFRNLPAVCTIRIYNIAGELVREIHHDHSGSIEDGSESWDLLSKDNLSVSYGMYIYHVDAPELGEHVGKFAIIK